LAILALAKDKFSKSVPQNNIPQNVTVETYNGY
jgi:hypothetical protein